MLIPDERLVYLDLETCGLEFTRPIIQIAAIATNSALRELETLEMKIQFDERDADPRALCKNNYDRELWQREAIDPKVAAKRFSDFLRRHSTVDIISDRTRRSYRVARLVAHNAERFDGPFLRTWYERLGMYLPAAYSILCTKQRAYWLFHEQKSLTPPDNFQLGTLCQYFDVRLRPDDAHDALNDVRATVALYRRMLEISDVADCAA